MTLWSMKFENRGFMIGPIIPIYGVGAVVATLLGGVLNKLPVWQLFLFGLVASAIIEYPTHYYLEKMFHRTWWDYSKAPLNINGRVCLPAAIGFGCAGVLILKVINPFIIPLILKIPDSWANGIALVLIVVFTADITLTITFISNFDNWVLAVSERVDANMADRINPHLNEDKKLSKHFYDAVDRSKQIPSNVRKRLKRWNQLGISFRHSVVDRLVNYREDRRRLFNKKDDEE